jgi:adenine-specific DNA methylase
MADKFDNRNTGALFQNDRKENDKHPDRTGSGEVACPHCGSSWQVWLSGWLRKTKDGKPFLSISLRPKEDQKRNALTKEESRDAQAPRRPPPRSEDYF